MRLAARALVPSLLLIALACAVPRPPGVPAATGVSTAPIRDRFARARVTMVEAVNADRARHGLPPVVLDSLATAVAQAHALEMATAGWLSHYNAAGLAPYERYAGAGGTGHVLENVFRSQRRSRAEGSPDDPWERFDIRVAQAWLMASEGHRKAILDPHRARIGVGIASDPIRGAVYVVQEFVTDAADIDPPRRVVPGQEVFVTGSLRTTGARPLMLVLSREPVMRPWVTAGERPPGGSYADGGEEAVVIPPWAIRWNPDDRSFSLGLQMARRATPARLYGILYVASDATVRDAVSRLRADTGAGWPAAAFVVEVL